MKSIFRINEYEQITIFEFLRKFQQKKQNEKAHLYPYTSTHRQHIQTINLLDVKIYQKSDDEIGIDCSQLNNHHD